MGVTNHLLTGMILQVIQMIHLHEICCSASCQICSGLFFSFFVYDFSLRLSQTRQEYLSFPPETPSLHVTISEDRSIVPQPQQTEKNFLTGNWQMIICAMVKSRGFLGMGNLPPLIGILIMGI